jgi:O-antigen ligase/cytochrome c-type biogenesis protein CcmH/NrfG
VARLDLYLVLAALILYLTIALYITSPKLRVAFVVVLLLLAGANCLVGAIQFFKGQNFMPFEFLPRPNYGTRASGFYGCPNHLAGFLEVVLLMALGLTFWSRWRLPGKIMAGYGAIVCGAGLLMTGSRGGYASTLAGLFVFAVLSLMLASRWLRGDLWSLLAILVAVVAVALGFSVRSIIGKSDDLSFRVEAAASDAPVRLALWKAAIRQFQLSPWIGTGAGTYLYYGRQFRDTTVQADPVYPHSDYLQLLAEYGLAGAAGFLLFLTCHLRSAWKFLADVMAGRTHSSERTDVGFRGSNSLALTVGALSSVAAYLVHSFVDFNLHIPPNTLLMAFVFGVLASPTAVAASGAKQPKAGIARFIGLIPAALGVWLIAIAAPKWPGEYYSEKARITLSDWHYIISTDVSRKAEEFARNGLEYDPKNPTLYALLGDAQTGLANLATTPTDRTRLYRASVETYEKALELAPNDVNLVFSLGWSLDALERFSESRPVFEKALALDPNSKHVHWAYAAHLHRQKKFAEAEAEYNKALALGMGASAQQGLQQLAEDVKKQTAAPAPPP